VIIRQRVLKGGRTKKKTLVKRIDADWREKKNKIMLEEGPEEVWKVRSEKRNGGVQRHVPSKSKRKEGMEKATE